MDWLSLSGKKVLACNAAAWLLPPGVAQWAIFGDKPFLRAFRRELRTFVDQGGILVNATGRPLEDRNHWMLHVQRRDWSRNWGIVMGTSPTEISWNRSTGGAAINLACVMGAAEIVLIGFDMKPKKEKTGLRHNWHSEYKPFYSEGALPQPDQGHYQDMMVRPFKTVSQALKDLGVPCWNTCEDSGIKDIPYRPLTELL